MSLQRPLDLAQPFLIDVHPIGCDCIECEAGREEPSLLRSIGECLVLGTGAVILGQVTGHVLNAAGILALLGIG
jgi:hypothetical protein